MSLPNERPSFEEPSPPIGRVQSGFAASFLFESGNIVQANLPNNNIKKGRWTQEEHKIFMQEYEKYFNNCMQIAKVLSTRTPAQIKKHAECFFKQNLKTNSAAVKQYQESLSLEKNQILCNDADAHKKTASPYLLRKRSKFHELMLKHIKKKESLILLKTKTYL
jgi:hypothetical protein